MKVYGSGLKQVNVVHRSEKESSNVRNPCEPVPTGGIGELEVQVVSIRESSVKCDADDISVLLRAN